jgi:malonyl-CoA O-methyltransferase
VLAEPPGRIALRRRFDRAAGGYDAAARLDEEVAARMLERLEYMRTAPARILDAGAGTGRDARALAARFRGAQVITLDFSAGMLRQAACGRGRLARWFGSPALALCGDIRRIPLATASVDLVWSNLVLHWLDDAAQAIREFARVMRPEGLLMLSAYGPDTLRELAAASARTLGGSRVRRFADMHDVGDMLVAAGFSNPVMDAERITLTYADARALLADLRATAQSAGGSSGTRGLGGRRGIDALCAALDEQRTKGRLAVTFEIAYGHAWKATPTRTAEGHAIMRAAFPRRPA